MNWFYELKDRWVEFVSFDIRTMNFLDDLSSQTSWPSNAFRNCSWRKFLKNKIGNDLCIEVQCGIHLRTIFSLMLCQQFCFAFANRLLHFTKLHNFLKSNFKMSTKVWCYTNWSLDYSSTNILIINLQFQLYLIFCDLLTSDNWCNLAAGKI